MNTALAHSTANKSTEDKALELLAAGYDQVVVANSLGISQSRISQLLSDSEFARKLAESRFVQLQKHNETDNVYDSLEKKALSALERTLPLVMDPMKLAIIITRLNQAKRRGSSAPESLVRQKPTVRLNINAAVVAKFSINGSNQVVSTIVDNETQDLVTIQSSGIQRLLNEHAKQSLVVPAIGNKGTRSYSEAAEGLGKRWIKPQGREKQDLLSECGFAVEVEVSQSSDKFTSSDNISSPERTGS